MTRALYSIAISPISCITLAFTSSRCSLDLKTMKENHTVSSAPFLGLNHRRGDQRFPGTHASNIAALYSRDFSNK
jgi:hypothetical protein